MLDYFDHGGRDHHGGGGEPVVELLRRGKAGSNIAADGMRITATGALAPHGALKARKAIPEPLARQARPVRRGAQGPKGDMGELAVRRLHRVVQFRHSGRRHGLR